jgi:hypothetical protein
MQAKAPLLLSFILQQQAAGVDAQQASTSSSASPTHRIGTPCLELLEVALDRARMACERSTAAPSKKKKQGSSDGPVGTASADNQPTFLSIEDEFFRSGYYYPNYPALKSLNR